MPVVSAPLIGNMSFIGQGSAGAFVLLGMAAVAAVLAHLWLIKWLALVGMSALVLLIYSLVMMVKLIGVMKTLPAPSAAPKGAMDMMLNAATSAVAQSVQIQWGWLPLLLGAGWLLVLGAAEIWRARGR